MTFDTNAPVAQHVQDSWGAMPKRKPVPATVTALDSEGTASGQTSVTDGKFAPSKKIRTWLPAGGLGLWFRSQTRSRKILIIGIGAGIVLIALIIGLAVGLTVGKKYASPQHLTITASLLLWG